MQTDKSKNNQADKIEKLRFALNNQIEWQKYAEGKNLLFLTITAGTLLFIYSDIDASKKESFDFLKNLHPFYLFFMLTSLTSFFVSLISLRIWRYKTVFRGKVSLISWDYARGKNKEELRRALENYDDDEHIYDLIVQHMLGSKVTYKKYTFFAVGMAIYSLGILSLIVEFVIRLFTLRH